MTGTKYLSQLITSPHMLELGKLNLIEANVSGGKTYFALSTLPQWAGSPDKILFLIDTSNGETRIHLQNILTISRMDYAMDWYGEDTGWGEFFNDPRGKMPVMTYAGFGSEILNPSSRFPFWKQFDYIVCDEIQNLVKYQNFGNRSAQLAVAETTLRQILEEGKTKVIGMSATPQEARKHFGTLCRDVPFDRTQLIQMETFEKIPYRGQPQAILAQKKGQTGILYTNNVIDMKSFIEEANAMGIRANGFWSANYETQKKHPFTEEQRKLREAVLWQETIPETVDLLVLNAASETSIKIRGEKRKVDYMIVHNQNQEVQTQVRGRYHGDLPQFYYHCGEEANLYASREVPEEYLNRRLYTDDCAELCRVMDLRKPNDESYRYCWQTVRKYLEKNGYRITGKKDKKKNGAHYYVIEEGEDGTRTGAGNIL